MGVSSFGFVILNYCGLDNTVKCVETVAGLMNNSSVHLIVVDNGSPDGSGETLRDMYRGREGIHIINNIKNLGFSKGMNKGVIFAKNVLKCSFIILMNNDVELLTDTFTDVIEYDYDRYEFAVLGPKIISAETNSPQINPYLKEMKTPSEKLEELHGLLNLRRRQLLYTSLKIDGVVYALLGRLKWLYRKIKAHTNAQDEYIKQVMKKSEEVGLNVPIHGSFIVLSPKYLEYYDGLEEVTFLYGEEWLLYNRCRSRRLLIMYDPKVQVFHEEHGTLKKLKENNRKFKKQRIKDEIDCFSILIEYIKGKLDEK